MNTISTNNKFPLPLKAAWCFIISLIGILTMHQSTAQTTQTYTSGSGTFTVPAGVTSINVQAWGGGGGGGG